MPCGLAATCDTWFTPCGNKRGNFVTGVTEFESCRGNGRGRADNYHLQQLLQASEMLRKILIIAGVTVFTAVMLVAATLRVNGGFETFSDVSAGSLNANVVEYAGLAREAYLYAQPLLDSYATMYQDIDGGKASERVGAFNTLKVLARVNGESDQLISIKAWLDLRTEPMLLHVPRGGRLLDGISISDLYGERALQIDSGKSDANYLVVAPTWKGEVPDGIREVIHSHTDLVQIHSATRVASAATFEHLKTWSASVALVPLSAYTMATQPKLAPRLKLP